MELAGCDFQVRIGEAVIACGHGKWGWSLWRPPLAEDAPVCTGASRERRQVEHTPRSGLHVVVLHLFPPLYPPSAAAARLEVPAAPGCSLLWLPLLCLQLFQMCSAWQEPL